MSKKDYSYEVLDPYATWTDPRANFDVQYLPQPPQSPIAPDSEANWVKAKWTVDVNNEVLTAGDNLWTKWQSAGFGIPTDGSSFERNQFGIRMYDTNCQMCREHVEDWYTCELCHQRACISLIHVEEMLEPLPMKPVSMDDALNINYQESIRGKTKERVTEEMHECPLTSTILINFLW